MTNSISLFDNIIVLFCFSDDYFNVYVTLDNENEELCICTQKKKTCKFIVRKQAKFSIFCIYFLWFQACDGDENDKYETIIQSINELKKKESRNGSRIKVMLRKLMDYERSESFSFPLRFEPDHENLEKCLEKPRFNDKLVIFFYYFISFYCRISHS